MALLAFIPSTPAGSLDRPDVPDGSVPDPVIPDALPLTPEATPATPIGGFTIPAVPGWGKLGEALEGLWDFLWGFFNKRPKRGEPVTTPQTRIDKGRTGYLRVPYTDTWERGQGYRCATDAPSFSPQSTSSSGVWEGSARGVEIYETEAQTTLACYATPSYTYKTLGFRQIKANGSLGVGHTYSVPDGANGSSLDYCKGPEQRSTFSMNGATFDGEPLFPQPEAEPLWPAPFPEMEPMPELVPLPAYSPPFVAPRAPERETETEREEDGGGGSPMTVPSAPPTPGTSPGTSPGPARPVVPTPNQVPWLPPLPAPPGPGTVPLPPPDQQIGGDGKPVPRPNPPPTVTPPGVEVTPDGQVGQPGTQPRPDLAGIAAEVGKIEQKVLQLQRREPPPFGDLTDLLQLILSLLQEPYGEGQYSITASCESADGGSEPARAVHGWTAGFGKLESLRVRVDALAAVLADAEHFRKRVCRRGQPAGPEVTVTFSEAEY